MSEPFSFSFSDEELDRLLRESFDEEPSAAGLELARRAAEYAERADDLAEIDYDSLEDGLLMRSDDRSDRAVTLSSGELTLEFEVMEDDGIVVGQLIPPGPTVIEVAQFARRFEVEVDESGRFSTPVEPGPLRLTVADGEARLVSPWITR